MKRSRGRRQNDPHMLRFMHVRGDSEIFGICDSASSLPFDYYLVIY